jgi:serine protease AprX
LTFTIRKNNDIDFMKRTMVLMVFTLLLFAEVNSQQHTRHIVQLRNKGNAAFTLANPLVYLSQRAIDRRLRYSIPIDSADLPVTPAYIQQIDNVPNVTILNSSKWLNSVTIMTADPASLTTIGNFPFVQSVTPIAARNAGRGQGRDKNAPILEPHEGSQRTERTAANYFNYGTQSFNEIHLHNGEFLHNIGLRGQGMQIGMLDNGYFNYPNLKAFDSARLQGQILGTWDFVARESNVANDGAHGMMCLSTIAANIPGQFIGKAPKASFWLYRTEDDASEYPIEEHNWVCGAERADSSGSDVISSSLGYFDFDDPSFDYTYADMNGNVTISARGADVAAKKGLLVFNAAGNEGNSAWHFIITPADADSIVAVGAVSAAGTVGSFSSYGPSSDGQIKPDVASVGVSALVQTTANTVGTNNGTSFACPNMAGLGTCLWQGFPEYNNMKIIQTLHRASHKFTTPDNRVGYGIPNMKTAVSLLLEEYATSTLTANGCRITLAWTSKDVSGMKYEIEVAAPAQGYIKVAERNPLPGTVFAPHNYEITHDLTGGTSGQFAVRIKQIIDTAAASLSFVYIDTGYINITSPCIVTSLPPVDPDKVSVTIGPNPTAGPSVNLIVESPFAVTTMPVLIFDEKGSLVRQQEETKGTGRKTIIIPVEKLPAGKYYIRVLNGSQSLGNAEMIRL